MHEFFLGQGICKENRMGTNDDSVWLCKINPKVLEVLNQLLKAMEQLSMAPPKEEPAVPHRMPGALLTVDEAAQRLAVSKYTLRGWVSQRRIPYVKIGRRTLFNPTDLDNLIKASTMEPRKPSGRY
jgi:excisionase family DNA binding protein